MTTGNESQFSDAFRFTGVYECVVTEEKCLFPEKWAHAKQMSLKWVKVHESGEQWYALVPASGMHVVPDSPEEDNSEISNLFVLDGKDEPLREETGDDVFEDDFLYLPDDMKDSVVLEGNISWIEVLPQEAYLARNKETDMVFTEILNRIDIKT